VLVEKSLFWEAEDDDQDFETTSGHFLTGLGGGVPAGWDIDGALILDYPIRHGMFDVSVRNCRLGDDELRVVRIRHVRHIELIS